MGPPETCANVSLSPSLRAHQSNASSTSKREHGWQNLQIYSDVKGDYTRCYVSADDGDAPGLSVFIRRNGTVRHFWSGEMSGEMADPGQDPRGAPDLDPLWTILDLTSEGRGATWY